MRREFYSLRNVLEGIAALDEQLIQTEEGFDPVTDDSVAPFAGILAFEFIQWHTFQSYLWVLAGYEFIRTVDQKIRKNPKCTSPQTASLVTSVKRHFERVRVPLAKLEAAKKHSATDRAIAYPLFDLNNGVAWTLNEHECIYRRDLSESLLILLERWEPVAQRHR